MTPALLLCRKNCRNNHSLTTDHNLSVLRTHGVDHLSYSELCQLLFQNDPWLLPEVSSQEGMSMCVSDGGEARRLEDRKYSRRDPIVTTGICLEEN